MIYLYRPSVLWLNRFLKPLGYSPSRIRDSHPFESVPHSSYLVKGRQQGKKFDPISLGRKVWTASMSPYNQLLVPPLNPTEEKPDNIIAFSGQLKSSSALFLSENPTSVSGEISSLSLELQACPWKSAALQHLIDILFQSRKKGNASAAEIHLSIKAGVAELVHEPVRNFLLFWCIITFQREGRKTEKSLGFRPFDSINLPSRWSYWVGSPQRVRLN